MSSGGSPSEQGSEAAAVPAGALVPGSWVTDVYILAQRLWYLVLASTGICGGALLCAAIFLAGLGAMGLGCAAVLHSFTPETQDVVASLHFDYREGRSLSTTAELVIPDVSAISSNEGRRPRISWAGQLLDVYLEVKLPEVDENCKVFMVEVSIYTPSGAKMAGSTRSALLECRPPALQAIHAMSAAPLSLLGLGSGARIMTVPLLRNHKVLKEESAASARVVVTGHAGGLAPQFYSAALHVHLNLGWAAQGLYFVRHNVFLFGALLVLAMVCLASGTCCALVGFTTILVALGTGVIIRPPQPPTALAATAGSWRETSLEMVMQGPPPQDVLTPGSGSTSGDEGRQGGSSSNFTAVATRQSSSSTQSGRRRSLRRRQSAAARRVQQQQQLR